MRRPALILTNLCQEAKHMKRFAIAALAALILSGCAGFHVGPNTATGASVGAVGGAIVDRNNPARGAIIGGALLGGIGAIADEHDRQGREDAWRRDQELRRWQHYCQHNWRRDYRCRY
ncbi:MAG TPA: hypothetical protein V6D17_13300 [Candidatus Obscuribacterales bacterium]